MSSKDPSQSPVAIPAPASPSSETLNGHAKLCQPCKDAHEALLCDTGTGSQWWFNARRPGCIELGRKGYRKLPQDEWPHLPRLTKSKEVCGFCDLLREALQSKIFSDACDHLTKDFRTSAGQETVQLEIRYEQTTSLSSWPTPGGDQDIFLIVEATFGGDITVNMHFEVEAFLDNYPVSDSPTVAEYIGLKDPVVRNYEHEEITSFLAGQLSNLPLSVEGGDSNAGFLPARLIEVGPRSLRLVEKSEIKAGPVKQPDYCALSYCWGPGEDAALQAKTTETNYQKNLEGLAFNKLSNVLQDAVKTTRALSISYLWVDSLCIIQGNDRDWVEQCTQMNKVYGNARVTLIAASSRTCREGFLKPKRPALRFPYQSARHPEMKGSFMMYFTHAYGKIKLQNSLANHYFMDLHNDLYFSQWARRGWTFQEHAMAKAHIVYGTSGVYFGREGSYVTKDGKAGPISPQAYISSLQTNQELHRAWENIMLRYSARKESSFTEIKDLLPALSGLARQFGNKLHFENELPVQYIAGHWLDRLHCTLLWENNGVTAALSLDEIKTRHGQDGEDYLIPTWSCLMRNNGQLDFYNSGPDYEGQYRDFRSELEILNVHASLASDDPYGAINSASLKLRGFLLDFSSLSWSESSRMLVGSADSETEIWLGGDGDPRQIISTANFYIRDRTSKPPQSDAQFNQHDADSIQRMMASEHREHESRFGGRNSCGFSPSSDYLRRPLPKRTTVYSYRMEREYHSEQDYLAEPGRMRASFDELIARVVLLLVASEKKPENMAIQESEGYGLLLIRRDGATKNSFLRVGMFRPQGYFGGLPCLKRLMKEETIQLF